MSSTVAFQIQASPFMKQRYPNRKRKPVSYLEIDLNYDFLFEIEENREGGGEEEEEDHDFEFGRPLKKQKHTAKPRKRSGKPFPFLSLPPELRNAIYTMVLTDPRGAHLRASSKAHRRIAKHCSPRPAFVTWCENAKNGESSQLPPCNDNGGDYRLAPALLATCKAIYREATPVLYGQRFVAEDGFALMSFLMGITPRHVAELRRMTVVEWCDTRSRSSTNLPAVALLQDAAARLERLETRSSFVQRFGPCGCRDLLSSHRRSSGSSSSSRFYCQNVGRDGRTMSPVVRLARKVYRDCWPLLYAVLNARGLDAALRIVKPADYDWELLRDRYGCTNAHQGPRTPSRDQCPDVDEYKRQYTEELRRLMTGLC